jgi:predicted ArsR family transcriptional regulator
MKPMAAPTTGTRLQILNLLQEKGEASVGQLAGDLELASATVRRHLDVLLRDRLVSYHQVRKSLGRPEYAYTLTEDGQEVLPKHYQDLLSDVLQEMGKLTPEDTMGRDGKALATLVFSRLAEKITHPFQHQDLEQRLAALLDILAKGDFSPDVERLDGGVRILLHNCPYRSVAQYQESVCFFDKSLISNLLHTSVQKEQCIRKGDKSCCYLAAPGK